MSQVQVSLTDGQAQFLNQFAALGYPDKSSLVRAAIDRFRHEVVRDRLRESAYLYAETYAEDRELQELTEQALEGWPE
jgi:Arc/MetJ-type ribon-helix-helix transcriptional regulator